MAININSNLLSTASSYFAKEDASLKNVSVRNGALQFSAVNDNPDPALNQKVNDKRDAVISAFQDEIKGLQGSFGKSVGEAAAKAPEGVTKTDLDQQVKKLGDRIESQQARRKTAVNVLCSIGKWVGIGLASVCTLGVFGLCYGLSKRGQVDRMAAQRDRSQKFKIGEEIVISDEALGGPEEEEETKPKVALNAFQKEWIALKNDNQFFGANKLSSEVDKLKTGTDLGKLDAEFKVIADKINALRVRLESKPKSIELGIQPKPGEMHGSNVMAIFRRVKTRCRTLLLNDSRAETTKKALLDLRDSSNLEFTKDDLDRLFKSSKYTLSEKAIANVVDRMAEKGKNMGIFTGDDVNNYALMAIKRAVIEMKGGEAKA